jgi:ATP diphosphatase
MEKIAEELDEVRQALATGDQVNLAEELGDVLFSCVNLVRHCQQDPESVLRACNTRFQQRFNHMEDLLNQQQGLDKAEPAQMETIWAQVKRDKQP